MVPRSAECGDCPAVRLNSESAQNNTVPRFKRPPHGTATSQDKLSRKHRNLFKESVIVTCKFLQPISKPVFLSPDNNRPAVKITIMVFLVRSVPI
jgi:hypothetical protein